MIQRIQTIYLLIGLIAWTLLFIFPTIGFTSEAGGDWLLFPKGIKEVVTGKVVLSTIPLLILFLIIEHMALISVLTYRKRHVQLRVTVLNLILQVLSYGLIALYTFQGKNMLDASPRLLFISAMPVVACFCSYLAFRGIRRDILLLRAQDRLR